MSKHPILASIGTALAIPAIFFVFLYLRGYYITSDAVSLAQFLVQNNLPASKCFKLIHFEPLSPSPSEKRISCIMHYAEIAQDPSVCEELMPSRYGLDCVGRAMNSFPCSLGADYSVSWIEKEQYQKISLKNCQQKNYPRSEKGDQCCTIASVNFLVDQNNCISLIKTNEVYDQCQYELATKNANPTDCMPIKNANIRAACTVNSTALKKDPLICEFCTKLIKSIDDIQ